MNARRTQRRRSLSESAERQFVADAAAFHEALVAHFRTLSPLCAHYRAMQQLHAALLVCIVEVTDREAPWCSVGPGRMPE